MKIIIGRYSGFCNGVKYTIEEANKRLQESKNVYCLGQIVHNERAIKDLEEKGMTTINSINECPNNSKLIIRAHGELKETYEEATKRNIEVIDLTCGKIKVIRNKIEKKKLNHYIVIIGKKNHPETLGVKSFAGKDSFIIEEKNDLKDLIDRVNKSDKEKIYIISQTTFNTNKFDEIVSLINNNIKKEIDVDKTICKATSNRQEETNELSKKVDIMIIIGGKNSSNTKELEIISTKNCGNVYLIQEALDLNNIKIDKKATIGIMAGASTPDIVVEETIEYLNNI